MNLPSYLRCELCGTKPCGAMLLAGLLCLSSGCVGLNIPSVRYNDPPVPSGQTRTIDQALLFARGGRGCAAADGEGGSCAAGGEAAADDDQCGDHAPQPKLPAVPWPRFHPLPTAPVFSNR